MGRRNREGDDEGYNRSGYKYQPQEKYRSFKRVIRRAPWARARSLPVINRAHLFVTRKQLNSMTYEPNRPLIVRHICGRAFALPLASIPSPFARNIRIGHVSRASICDYPSMCARSRRRKETKELAFRADRRGDERCEKLNGVAFQNVLFVENLTQYLHITYAVECRAEFPQKGRFGAQPRKTEGKNAKKRKKRETKRANFMARCREQGGSISRLRERDSSRMNRNIISASSRLPVARARI